MLGLWKLSRLYTPLYHMNFYGKTILRIKHIHVMELVDYNHISDRYLRLNYLTADVKNI